jgi:hypothetical protein
MLGKNLTPTNMKQMTDRVGLPFTSSHDHARRHRCQGYRNLRSAELEVNSLTFSKDGIAESADIEQPSGRRDVNFCNPI